MKKSIMSVIAVVVLVALGAGQAPAQGKIDKNRPIDPTAPVKRPAGTLVPRPKGSDRLDGVNLDLVVKVVALTNAFRVEQSKPKLKSSAALDKIANRYAILMASKDQSGHNVDGKDAAKRLTEAGYAWTRELENVGWNFGQKDPVAWMVQAWKDSKDGHREAMLSTEVTEIGVGVAKSSTGKFYFCQLFAKPK